MKRSAVALIDGEHYPSVVVDALRQAADRFEFRAALFLGGAEKIDADGITDAAADMYGLPVVVDSDWRRGLDAIVERFSPEVVVDLSDEPVLGYEQRFRLISYSLARNVGYVGSDFHFSPAGFEHRCTSPSLSIVGTGKRVGKTAVSGHVARVLKELVGRLDGRPGVVVVAMGRGGPAEPEVIDGANASLTVKDLVAFSRQGRHAASDHIEDAILSGIMTIGCRRCGGGMAGTPFFSNVGAGVRVANSLRPGLVILEGSGATMPPVASDARLLVAAATQPVEHIAGYLGAYRLLVSDAVVLTMAEEPFASEGKVRAIIDGVREVRPGMVTIPVVFRPRPHKSVEGKRVAFFSTAAPASEPVLRHHLENEFGCRVEMFSGNLSDRGALRADLMRPEMGRVDAVLTEVKAAAIDVVAEEAEARGLEVVFVDNLPVEAMAEQAGRLDELAEELAQLADRRFRGGA